MRKQKKLIMALVLLLAVGFAAVTTTLLINGNALIRTTEFDVYFSSASIDGVENNALISQDGKSITYETANLQIAGDTSKLDYTITNNSSYYDAEVSITCDFSENDYVRLENSLQNEVIEAKSEKSGTLTAILIKTSTEERSQGFTCTIVANAKERDTAGSETVVPGEINTYSVYGTLADEDGNKVANTTLVTYSNPVYTVTDENGYFYMEGIEKGSHTLYVMGSKSIDEVKELSEEEVAEQAVTYADFTSGSLNIVFPNGYKVVDTVVEKTVKVTVSFDPNGIDREVEDKIYTVGKDLVYGELEQLTRDNYTFLGWYNEDNEKIESTTKVDKTITKLIAKWEGKKSTITFNANGGTVNPTSIEVTYGEEYPNIPTPTRNYGEFLGWKDTDGKTVELKGTVILTEALSLTAEWKAVPQCNTQGDICWTDIDFNNIKSIGDIVTLGTEKNSIEHFYILTATSSSIQMLSMYNLYVGGEYTTSWTAYQNPTGIQNSTMIGSNAANISIRRGTTPFSNADQKGTNYSTYEGSIVEGYVKAYSTYLSGTLGIANTATLISKADLEAIKGDGTSLSAGSMTSWAPSFLYSTSYWTRSDFSTTYIWYVIYSGNFNVDDYLSDTDFGVRPVVTINADLVN